MTMRPSSSVALDWTVLRQVVGESVALRDRLLASFVVEAEHKLSELQEAFDTHQLGSARVAAHQLRGAAKIVGAERLAETAGFVEGLHDLEDKDIELKVGSELRVEFERFKEALTTANSR